MEKISECRKPSIDCVLSTIEAALWEDESKIGHSYNTQSNRLHRDGDQ